MWGSGLLHIADAMWQAWANTSDPPLIPIPHWYGANLSAWLNVDAATVAATLYKASPIAIGLIAPLSDFLRGISLDLVHIAAFPALPSMILLTS